MGAVVGRTLPEKGQKGENITVDNVPRLTQAAAFGRFVLGGALAVFILWQTVWAFANSDGPNAREAITIWLNWRVGHLDLEQQRRAALERGDTSHAGTLKQEPTKHRGPKADAMECNGAETQRGTAYRRAIAANRSATPNSSKWVAA